MTVYRDDSEVSRLNATAHLGPVAVEPGLFGLLETAVALSRETGGRLRRDVGGPLGGLGIRQGSEARPGPGDPGRRPGTDRLAPPAARPGASDGRLRPRGDPDQPGEHRQGLRHRPGRRADPGLLVADVGPGPRRPVEPLRARLAAGPVRRPLGDRAAQPVPSRSRRWACFRLRNRGLGTSGAAFQQFVVDGRVYGHIIDPRTGEPALGTGQRDGPGADGRRSPTPSRRPSISWVRCAPAAYVAGHPEIGVVIVERGPDDAAPRLSVFGLGEYDFVAEPGTLR